MQKINARHKPETKQEKELRRRLENYTSMMSSTSRPGTVEVSERLKSGGYHAPGSLKKG